MFSPAPERLVHQPAFALLLVLLSSTVAAQSEHPQRVIDLWKDGPPETQKVQTQMVITERGDPNATRDRFATGITKPNLVVFEAAEPNGKAMLIIPGGGYERVVIDKEGFESAEWFQKRGISSFVLMYRLPAEGWTNGSDVPLQDAQRAIRWIRGNAGEFGIHEDQIGVIGFSAGGHVAASLATGFNREVYSPTDGLDELSARPDFAVLMYPVITMHPDIAHGGSREKLLGAQPSDEAIQRYSVESNVHVSTPPVFLLHATDDDFVLVENSLHLYRALKAAGIATDLHLFSSGGHGFGLRYSTDKPVADWPLLVERWLVELE